MQTARETAHSREIPAVDANTGLVQSYRPGKQVLSPTKNRVFDCVPQLANLGHDDVKTMKLGM